MSIVGISGFKPIQPVLAPKTEAVTGGADAKGKASFSDMFQSAIKDVDSMQRDANQKIEGLLTGQDGIAPHDTMLALEKADIAFQLMNQVRTKLITAYQEIMRTQI